MRATVVGGGLAGCEAAWALAFKSLEPANAHGLLKAEPRVPGLRGQGSGARECRVRGSGSGVRGRR